MKPILLICLSAGIVCSSMFTAHAQKRWDGEGGDGNWENALNWNNNVLPASTDNVLLDNTFVTGSYTVTISGSLATISTGRLQIAPSAGNIIQVIIPSSNTTAPAFKTMTAGYSLQLDNGGVFINASGASSGNTLSITDSIKINNGGRYIHRTQRAHAYLADALSAAAGTEDGTFEFDIPVASASAALQGRTFGNLVFSATTIASHTNTYTASGSGTVLVRGNWIINSGSSVSLGLTGTLTINGNCVHNGNTFNLSNGTNGSPVINCKKNIVAAATAVFTETGSGLPVLVCKGSALQQVDIQGNINNSIAFKIDNTAGVSLQSPLRLPYSLVLSNGRLVTRNAALLTLDTNCTVQADTLSNNSYVEGPMRKAGLAGGYFLFPLGKNNLQRWLALKEATGSFTVAYYPVNPNTISNILGDGIAHISPVEYWSVDAGASPASARIELSFYDPNTSTVTDISAIRVAQLSSNTWQNAGAITTTGSAGGRGSVVSNAVTMFASGNGFFAIAGSVGQGPLAVRSVPDVLQAGSSLPGNGRLRLTANATIITGNQIYLTAIAGITSTMQLTMMDTGGRLIQRTVHFLRKGNNALIVPLHTSAAGIYYFTGTTACCRSNIIQVIINH